MIQIFYFATIVYGTMNLLNYIFIDILLKINMKYKYLNIIFYSEIENDPATIYYKEMKKLLNKYLETLDNIFYYFCYFDENIDTEYIINNEQHVIILKGKESTIPGFLQKIIKSIEITKNIDYDYFIRTNISTIVNFELLDTLIDTSTLDKKIGLFSFLIPYIYTLYNSYNTSQLMSTIIGISKENSLKLLDYKFMYKSADDVEISYYFSTNKIDGIIVNLSNGSNNYSCNTNIYNPNVICYRNKTQDRKLDVSNIEILTTNLIYNKINIFNIEFDNDIKYINNIEYNSRYIYIVIQKK